VELINVAVAMMNYLLLHVYNYGELGTVRNILTHSFPGAITQPQAELEAFLGYPLPPDALPPTLYSSDLPARLIVPTVRSDLSLKEDRFVLSLMVLSTPEDAASGAVLYYRYLDSTLWTSLAFESASQGQVFSLSMPNPLDDFEYYIQAKLTTQSLFFPLTAPQVTQTVVVS